MSVHTCPPSLGPTDAEPEPATVAELRSLTPPLTLQVLVLRRRQVQGLN